MPYGGRRQWKMYSWWSGAYSHRIRSFSSEDNAIRAFNKLPGPIKQYTDVWYEVNKQTPKQFVINNGKGVN